MPGLWHLGWPEVGGLDLCLIFLGAGEGQAERSTSCSVFWDHALQPTAVREQLDVMEQFVLESITVLT